MKSRDVKYLINLLILNLLVVPAFAQYSGLHFENDSTFKIAEVKSNTLRSDFGPAIVGDTLFFTSYSDKILGQPDAKLRKKAFYDLYEAKIDANGNTISKREPLVEFLTKYHDGPVSYCKKTGELFVTQSDNLAASNKIINMKDTIRLRIVIAKRSKGKWTSITDFPFNNPSFSMGHPAISLTGDTIVFSSDKYGGFGETDLYYSIRTNGKWGLPVNMGPQINTSGKEEFSFIYYDNNGKSYLIFASNRKLGLGGLDLYYTTFPFQANKIEHFEAPINTPFDDFSMVIPPDAGFGYFTSNRTGTGSDDIYKFTFKKNVKSPFVVENPLTEVLVKEPVKELYVFNSKTLHPISSAVISSCNQQVYISDIGGEVKMFTNQKNECEVTASKTGYSGVRKVLVAKNLKKGEINRDTIWMQPAMSEKITLNNIYYNYDKWDIIPESAKELDILTSFMKENPELKVQLSSFTDSRGDDSYNMRLSQRRAESAVNYIISNGINSNRITGFGYGETQLVNRCSNGVNCTEQEHRQNRRTEIYIPEFGKALDVIQTQGQFAGSGSDNQLTETEKKNGTKAKSIPISELKNNLSGTSKSRNIDSTVSDGNSIAAESPVVQGTKDHYLILRSFQTKIYAEKYVREIGDEIPDVQVVGEITPFRVGIRYSSYKEALSAKKRFVDKYSDCWILK